MKIFEPEKMRVRVCAEKKEQEFLSLKTDALHGPLKYGSYYLTRAGIKTGLSVYKVQHMHQFSFL